MKTKNALNTHADERGETANPQDMWGMDVDAATYDESVVTRGIRQFVSRDWEAARENKERYWAVRIAQLGPCEGLRIADELRRQGRQQNPSWPDASDRDADLSSHIRVAGLLRRGGSASRR